MPLDRARMDCIDTALIMARSGKYDDIDDVETAMLMHEPWKAHKCLHEPSVRDQVNKVCAIAKLNQQRARQSL